MCMFCVVIPAAAATGAALNNGQMRVLDDDPGPPRLPALKITAGAMVVLLAGSVTRHTLTLRP